MSWLVVATNRERHVEGASGETYVGAAIDDVLRRSGQWSAVDGEWHITATYSTDPAFLSRRRRQAHPPTHSPR